MDAHAPTSSSNRGWSDFFFTVAELSFRP